MHTNFYMGDRPSAARARSVKVRVTARTGPWRKSPAKYPRYKDALAGRCPTNILVRAAQSG